MRARAIFVATGIFRPSYSGRTEYALAGFSLHRLFTRAIGPRQPRRAVFEQVRATPLLQQRLLDLAMWLGGAVGQQMLDRRPALGQPTRDQHGAMAVERLLLGAHQAELGVGAGRDQPADCVLESRPRRRVVVASAALRHAAQRLALPGVVDAGLLEAPCQSLTPELREASRVGHRAHIDQALHAARLQQRDEALDGMVGMADGLDRSHERRRTRSMKASVAADRSSARQARLSGTLIPGRPAKALYVTPSSGRRLSDAGTMVMPSPAATRLSVETMRGASWTTCGLKPASAQAAMITSYRPRPSGRR